MADIYEKLLGLDTPAVAPQATEDPYEAALRRQAALPSQYSQAEPTLRLSAPYRPEAFPGQAPQPWNQPVPTAAPGQPLQVVGEGQGAGAGPRTMPGPRSLVGDIFRVPYAFARNAITALPGLPGDLGMLVDYGLDKVLRSGPGWGSPERPGTGPRTSERGILPTQESLNTRINALTGVTGEPPPGWAGAPERVAGVIGSSVGPGAIVRKVEPALKLTSATSGVWNVLKNSLSAGAKGDIAIGAGSGVTMEVIRQFFSDNPWLLAVGGALGGLATGLLHGGMSLLSKPYQRAQAVEDTAEALAEAQRTGRVARTSAVQDVQTARDIKDIEVPAAQAASRSAVDPELSAARAKQGIATTAKQDVTEEQAAAVAQEVAAQAQTTGWAQTARQEEQRAKAALAQAQTEEATGGFAALEPTLQQTNPPQGTLATGQAIKEQVQESGEAAAAQAAAARGPAYETATAPFGPRLENQGLIDLTKGDFQPQFQAAKEASGTALDTIEAEIAKAAKPVGGVDFGGFRSQIEGFVDDAIAQRSPQPPPGVLAWAELGLSEAQKKGLKGEGLARAKQALQLTPDNPVDFRDLRAIDRELGASGRGAIVGTLNQGKVRAMKRALNDDFDRFFESDAGTGLGPAYDLAKGDWKTFRTNFDKSILGSLLDERAGFQNQNFIGFLHGITDKTMPQLDFILDHASDETRAAISAHMAAHMASKSLDAAGNLNPKVLQSQVAALRKNGTFDKYFDQTQQQTIMDQVQTMTAADTSIEPAFRKAIARTAPEQVPTLVFQPGNMSYTQKFQQISQPQQFQDAVAGWVADVTARLPDMSPAQIAKELAPMAVKHDGVSQLDLMFAHIPGGADQISDMLTAQRALPGRTQAARDVVQQRTGEVARAKETGAAYLQSIQEQNQARLVPLKQLAAEAETEYKDAVKQVAQARAAGSDVTRQTREDATQAVKDAQRKQRDTKRDVETETQAAKDRLKEARAAETKGGKVAMGWHKSVTGAALTGILTGMLSNNPKISGASAILLGAEAARYGAHRYLLSPRGQQWIRTGAQQTYGPKAAAFAAQVAGQQVPAMVAEEALAQQQQSTP